MSEGLMDHGLIFAPGLHGSNLSTIRHALVLG